MKGLFRRLSNLLILVALVCSFQVAAAPVLRFFAFGDLPYTEAQAELLESMLSEVREDDPPFLIHIGDVKSGSQPCTREVVGRMAGMFRAQPVPVVYTPGDNEWTDCRRPAAGGYDPTERLAVLRELYYEDPEVLRLQELRVVREDPAYPENFRFIYERVMFATVHVVGSDNNLVVGDPDATAELAQRSEANRTHLRAAIKAANAAEAAVLVLLFHANPGLEAVPAPLGFDRFHQDLAELLRDYAGQVLAIHGDSHEFQFNHPLRDPGTGEPIERFTRLEVPGSPTVAGVWVTLDPTAAQPVSVELVYPDQDLLRGR